MKTQFSILEQKQGYYVLDFIKMKMSDRRTWALEII